MNSFWSTTESTAWRSFSLLNGGCSALKRMISTLPILSGCWICTPRERCSCGSRSTIGFCHQSASPACIAAALVALSGMIRHSMRSKFITLPPEVKRGGSLRGTYFSLRA